MAESKRVHCFYHSVDLDGMCSGAQVRANIKDVIMHPINYGDPFPWGAITTTDEVFMVDFSLHPFTDMIRLNDRCRLVWIDHHESALEEHDEYAQQHPAFSILGREFVRARGEHHAACELVWHWFNTGDFGRREVTPPMAVTLLGLYDSWRYKGHELEDMVLPFQERISVEDMQPNTEHGEYLWSKLLDRRGEIHNLVEDGRLLLRAREAREARTARRYAFSSYLGGHPEVTTKFYRAITLNGASGSRAFNSVWDNDQYHLMLGFTLRPDGLWDIGLYSDRADVNCGEIARGWGGGGHKGAAGFQCDHIPFNFNMGPIVYIGTEPEDADLCGWSALGWYFWDETQSQCYGPFEDVVAATLAYQRYVKELG